MPDGEMWAMRIGSVVVALTVAVVVLVARLPLATRTVYGIDAAARAYRQYVPEVAADSAPPRSPAVESALDSLAPAIKDYVAAQLWFADGIDAREMLLLRFLGDANDSSGENHTLPVTFVPAGSPGGHGSTARLTVARQEMVLKSQLFDYVMVGEKQVLIVVSAPTSLTRTDADPTIAMVMRWLPFVAKFTGAPYPFYYVHVEINIADASYNYSFGPNLFLRSAFAAYAKSFCHELTHTMQFGKSYPTWFIEGAADLVAVHLTGVHNLAYPITNKQIHLDLSAKGMSNYSEEASGGYQMLQEVTDIIGYDAMEDALSEIFAESKHGQAIIDLLLAHTPLDQHSAVVGVMQEWIGDYPQ